MDRDDSEIEHHEVDDDTDSPVVEHQEPCKIPVGEYQVNTDNKAVEYEEDKVPAHFDKENEERQSRELTEIGKQKHLEALEKVKLEYHSQPPQRPKHRFDFNVKGDNKNLDKIRNETSNQKKLHVLYRPAGRPVPGMPTKYGAKMSTSQEGDTMEHNKESENGRPGNYHDTDVRPVATSSKPESDIQNHIGPSLPEYFLRSTVDGLNSKVLEYRMVSRPRGIVVVINIYEFHSTGLERRGAYRDTEALNQLFEAELGFIVKDFKNLTAAEVIQKLKEIADIDHTKYDCFVCIICSHGQNNYILGSDCREFSLDAVKEIFRSRNCPSLSEKPKLFFIQACKGQNREGIQVNHQYESDSYPSSLQPAKSDELMGYATVEDHASFRHPETGSVYIQTFVKYIRQLRHTTELCQILTKVNQKVGEAVYQLSGRRVGKQMPKYESTLMKMLFLRD